MKFVYLIETITSNGSKETSGQTFIKDAVIIGRGGRSDIRFESAIMSLEHAKLSESGGSLVVEDMNSISGLLVNDAVVSRSNLSPRDTIRIGDIVFTVTKDGDIWGLREERAAKSEDQSADQIKKTAQGLDVSRAMPPFGLVAIILSAIVLVLFGVLPLVGINQYSWTDGPVTSHHRMIDAQCSSCHGTPFVAVQDSKCISCHNMSDHSDIYVKTVVDNPEKGPRCATCHMEHKGHAALKPEESKLCADCHANIRGFNADITKKDVPNFARHPEFQVTLLDATKKSEPPVYNRVSLSDTANLVDGTRLKLNHKVHLKEGLRGANGPVNMICTDCHKLSADFKTITPITFEANCRSCHPLGFDERLAGNETPHGNADQVFNYMYAEYAKFFLATQAEDAAQEEGFVRFRPGEEASQGVQRTDYVRKYVEAESRVAEQLIFTRTGCKTCHEVLPKSEGESELGTKSTGMLSKYHIVKPQLPKRWMPSSIFSHGSHAEMKCESCHIGVRESDKTTDVLLPKIDSCRACHSEDAKSGTAPAQCTECHSFHDSQDFKFEKKRSSDEILLSIKKKG